ncbi:DUF308 domain-containing protein [Paenibacillus sp. UNC499MF]|uniref:DUF308 domain-containing protein n=1 Tax=Paenibacillus sp. UNC499MF TaxID=1502751 RepID=UPI0008A00AA4|nr:DUF308 domain-containing protein [Paenibacillus sp. UNC499MF]SEF97030.1 hypothetical protein SAMN02799616_01610 [Paenibacillus sp. UNC499MF]
MTDDKDKEQPFVSINRQPDSQWEGTSAHNEKSEPLRDPGLPSSSSSEYTPPPVKQRKTSAFLAVLCGILAVLFNLLVVTLPLGIILGITAFGSGLVARRSHRRSAGLVLSLFSFLIAGVWLASAMVPLAVDPTIRVGLRLP